MGTFEQANNALDLNNGICNLITNIAGNTCRFCGQSFIPHKKNDELCPDCAYSKNSYSICIGCGSYVAYSPDGRCCQKCFDKFKKKCYICGYEFIPHENENANLCSSCQMNSNFEKFNL